MLSELTREDLIKRLKLFDAEVFAAHPGKHFSVIIVGGGALILVGVSNRVTHDIDVLNISKELGEFLNRHDINARAGAYIDAFPIGFEERTQVIPGIDSLAVEFRVAALEDIVISKIYAYRDNDIADIESEGVLAALNWEKLHILAEEESRDSALNERSYRAFKDRFDDYERRFRPQ